jgi:hypothetical protein
MEKVSWSSDYGVLSNPQGVIVRQLEPVVEKNWSPIFSRSWNNNKKIDIRKEIFELL